MNRLSTLAGSIALAVSAFAVPAAAHDDENVHEQIAAARQATVHFHDITAAEAAGYGRFQDCVDEPGEGAMGIHYVNGGLLDDVIDPLQPEALMYEPDSAGRMRLVGAEYIVFQERWDAANAEPPMLFGHEFHLVESPNRYGIPAFYELHLWMWRHNPSGMFNDWNPKVTCEGAAGTARGPGRVNR